MKKAGTNVVNKRTIKKDCIDDFLKSIPVFLHLTNDALGEVRKHLFKKQFAKGKKVFEKGDHVETLYIVEAGKIEIYKTDDEGRRLTLWYINPGELFCVPTLLYGTAIANAETVKDAVMYCLDKSTTTLSADIRSFPSACCAAFRAEYRAIPALLKHLPLPEHQVAWRTFFYDTIRSTIKEIPYASFLRMKSLPWPAPAARPCPGH
jgi:hypothetical protein